MNARAWELFFKYCGTWAKFQYVYEIPFPPCPVSIFNLDLDTATLNTLLNSQIYSITQLREYAPDFEDIRRIGKKKAQEIVEALEKVSI